MMEIAISQENSSSLPPDLRIDDGDLPLAKNFFEFATGPKFLNTKPFPKQLEIAINTLAEYCPRCSDCEYVLDIPKKASYEKILERVQLLEFGICPRCKVTKTELYRNQEMKIPVELAGLIGQRGGKSSGSVMIAGAYACHRFLKLSNASEAFGLLPNDELQGTFVAQTYEKAKEKLYNPLYNYLSNTPWFQEYHKMLDHYGEKFGERLYRVSDSFTSYRVRKMLIRPAGPDKRKLRGDTSFTGIIDELGWFDADEGSEKKVKQNASEIYTALRNSFRTLRSSYYRLLKSGYYNMPVPIFSLISSPSSKRDQMVKNYEASKRSKSIIGFHYCVAGNTILATDHGLRRIDELIETDDDTATLPINLTLLGESGPVKIAEWHKTGVKKTYTVITKSGYQTTISRNHRFKVLRNNEYQWIKTKNLTLDDYLVINSQALNNQNTLPLNLPEFSSMIVNHPRSYLFIPVKTPKIMTPDLAYLIGAIVAEGSLTHKHIDIPNTNTLYLNHLTRICSEIFGITPVKRLGRKAGESHIHNGVVYNNNQDLWRLSIGSKVICPWFNLLGIRRITASKKRLPWSIMQADYQSQAAFIAAYIDSDGWIGDDGRIGISSKSIKLLTELQILLNSLGIISTVDRHILMVASQRDCHMLYSIIEPYLQIKIRWNIANPVARNHGFPFRDLQNFFRARKLGPQTTNCIADDGSVVQLSCTYAERNRIFHNENRKYLTYDAYARGEYTAMLDDLAKISPTEHAKILGLLTAKNWHTQISEIKYVGKKSVYDLTVDDSFTPAFSANGLIVHNSTWEFNPTLSKRDFDDDFAANADKAWRDFGAVPPNSSSPFIPDLRDLRGVVDSDLQNTVSVYPKIMLSNNGREMRSGKLRIHTRDQNKRIAAIDAGYSNNSFALACGFRDEATMRPVIDTLIEIQPTPDNPINHNSMYEDIISPLIEQLNIKLIVSDRWQNLKLLHDAEAEHDVAIEQYSLKYGDFEAVRQDIWHNAFSLPYPEMGRGKIERAGESDYPGAFVKAPVSHLFYQIITVKDMLKAVEKGDGVTDDIFRAFVLAHSFITDDEYIEFCLGKTNSIRQPHLSGVIGSRGGSNTSSNIGSGVIMGSGGRPIGLVASLGSMTGVR